MPTPLTELPKSIKHERIPLSENSPFEFWVDLDRLIFVNGVARWNPISVPVTPGIQGVPQDGSPGTVHNYQTQDLKRIPVPLDFKVKAWGETVTGYMVRMDIGKDRRGKQLYHYHDVWTRYEVRGRRIRIERDEDGWSDFRQRLEKMKLRDGSILGTPDEASVEDERQRILSVARDLRRMTHQSPGAGGIADDLEAPLQKTA
jgi:hypothetical protein